MVTTAVAQRLTCSSILLNVGQWNYSIREAVNQGYAQKALTLFRQLKQNGLEPNHLTFPFIAKACAKVCNLKQSEIIHTHVVKSPFGCDVFVQTALVDMYVKCGRLDDAYKAFDKMPVRDLASWNVMILGFAYLGFVERLLIVFNDMRFVGIRPDSVTVMGLTQGFLYVKDLKMVGAVHSVGVRIGVDDDVSVANTWIAAYSKCGAMGLAVMVFDRIRTGVRTVVSWNSIIAGYAYFEEFTYAFDFYKLMLVHGHRPDTSTIVSLLSSCGQPEALIQGMLTHSHGIKLGCELDVSVLNTLVSMYSKCADIESARFVFDGMFHRTRVSWTAMISGYSKKGEMDEALALFNAMEAAGEEPDLVTVISLISGCSQTRQLELGKWIYKYVLSNGLMENVIVCNALVDMYAKCGSMNDARELFRKLPGKTVVSWTTMISGCALNGQIEEALGLFNRMIELGIKPNHITFLAILQACTHGGLLEKGWECFNLMTQGYNIHPGLDHYSCMVDLLGRKGKLREALKFIQNMPIKPDAGIWSALLSSSKIHHDIEIGEQAYHRLLEIQPQVAVPYVEMANLYASTERWEGVARIRRMMRTGKVRKFPGQSLVQVDGKNHVFTVEDRGHHEYLVIYETLDCLSLQSKEELLPHLEGFNEH